MIQALKNILGFGSKTNYKQLIADGAIIVDVRSAGEFANGHIKNSLNIPVNSLKNNLSKLKNQNQTIITCCASGMRSSAAKSILSANGYTNVFNGGGWASLQSKI